MAVATRQKSTARRLVSASGLGPGPAIRPIRMVSAHVADAMRARLGVTILLPDLFSRNQATRTTATPSAAITSALRGWPLARRRDPAVGPEHQDRRGPQDVQARGPGPGATRRRSPRARPLGHPGHVGQDPPGGPARGAERRGELHQRGPLAQRLPESRRSSAAPARDAVIRAASRSRACAAPHSGAPRSARWRAATRGRPPISDGQRRRTQRHQSGCHDALQRGTVPPGIPGQRRRAKSRPDPQHGRACRRVIWKLSTWPRHVRR